MPLLEGLMEGVLDVVLEAIGEMIGSVAENLFYGEPKKAAVLSNYHCLGCQKSGKLKMRKRFWRLYECDSCQREWSVHRTKYLRQPGRAIEFRNRRTQKPQ
jgi:hypothetical protein